LREVGRLSQDDFEFFAAAYRLLRTVESRLRLLGAAARDQLPDDPVELAKLARQLGYASGEELVEDCRQVTAETRRRFEAQFAAAAQGVAGA
jgi:glutamine synthetase adenylyltransferase